MKVTIPKYFLGQPIDGTLEKIIAQAPQTPTPPAQAPSNVPTPANILRLEDYIILPEQTNYGDFSYPEFLVGKHRLAYSTEVEQAVNRLKQASSEWNNLKLENSATEADNSPFIGNMNWKTALALNATLGNETLTPRQYVDFLLLLRNGLKNKAKVYSGAGRELSITELNTIYKEIAEVRDPYRAEWLDAKFNKISDKMYILSPHELLNGNLVEKKGNLLLPGYVENDTYVELESANAQGIPTKKADKNNREIYYWYPRDGAAAWFGADSGGAGLLCSGVPTGSVAWLGVRPARKKI